MLLAKDTLLVTRKELTLFFSSPIAYLFLACFIIVILYLFFWVETFFARNIADIRPLFQWLPVLLIFLSAALTMRMWSEERRTGTLEFVLTSPVSISHFVLGKFYACLILLMVALALTLPIPIMVAMIADIDSGPVIAAYIASILLGASYLSIGLFVSARSDSQIVSLMVTTLLCGLFNLLGSSLLTDFFGIHGGEILRLLGSGSRFESIERGIIDVRDLYFYFSISIVFLLLNGQSLYQQAWAHQGHKSAHIKKQFITALLVFNILLVNVWLYPFSQLRADITQGQIYSLSGTSQEYLDRLQEPMLIRGYFSAKTHPLLSPLVPQIKDLLKEYEIAGKGRVRVELVDPAYNAKIEDEANKKYGIKSVPLQVTDKYQAALVNSYFNILIEYGDQFEVLGFRDLIEVKASTETDIDVRLRNPEYDITRAIKKAMFAYRSAGNLFEHIPKSITVSAYISAEKRLPSILKKLKTDVTELLDETQQKAADKIQVRYIEPEESNGQLTKMLLDQYGFKPMQASLLDKDTFYFYVILEGNGQVVQIPLPVDYKIDGFKRSLQAGLKRFASGFLKTAGVVAPPRNVYLAQLGQSMASFEKLKTSLLSNLSVKDVNLKKGQVPGDIDILLVLAPKELTDVELFAVDQFVMQGGTLVIATSPYSVEVQNNKLLARQQTSGLEDWLQHIGIQIQSSLVMDPKNAAFPIPITREVEGYTFQEVRMLDYPYFVDIREGLSNESAITSALGQLTMNWASPIELDKEKNSQRRITPLLSSSAQSWRNDKLNIMPRLGQDGKEPFPVKGQQQKELLGVILEGQFSSYFQDKDIPQKIKSSKNNKKEPSDSYISFINHSADNARVIVFSSNEFLQDQSVGYLSSAANAEYLNSYQLIANSIDWSLEDRGLLKIRSRGNFNRTLPPMDHKTRLWWEYSQYGFVFIAIVIIAIGRKIISNRKKSRYRSLLKIKGGHANE